MFGKVEHAAGLVAGLALIVEDAGLHARGVGGLAADADVAHAAEQLQAIVEQRYIVGRVDRTDAGFAVVIGAGAGADGAEFSAAGDIVEPVFYAGENIGLGEEESDRTAAGNQSREDITLRGGAERAESVGVAAIEIVGVTAADQNAMGERTGGEIEQAVEGMRIGPVEIVVGRMVGVGRSGGERVVFAEAVVELLRGAHRHVLHVDVRAEGVAHAELKKRFSCS